MGSLSTLVFVIATLLVCNYMESVSGSCPPKNKVYDAKPICHSDADCQKWGKICCYNQHNTKSCVYSAPWNNNNAKDQKYNGYGGSGKNCGGVRCMPYEDCKQNKCHYRG